MASQTNKKAKKKTATKMVSVGFLLDETGSMEVVKDKTISAFNEYVDTLRKDGNEYKIMLGTFNSSIGLQTVAGLTTLDKIRPLDYTNYEPHSNTPLLDATAGIIHRMEGAVPKKDAVLIVILTDGEENASREHTHKSVAALIAAKEKLGWSFIFLAANMDAWRAGALMGVAACNTMSYDVQDIQGTVATAGAATKAYTVAVNRAGYSGQSVTTLLSTAAPAAFKKARAENKRKYGAKK